MTHIPIATFRRRATPPNPLVTLLLTGLFAAGLSACSAETPAEPGGGDEVRSTQLTQTRPARVEPTPQTATAIAGAKVPTDSGAYLITLRPRDNRYEIGTLQAWVASITDADGNLFTPNALYFDGGMPGHGHGLPSAPQFTRHLGGADYLLEGVRLNMPGDWRFVVSVGGPAGIDSAVFNLNIQPGTQEPTPDQTKLAADPWKTEELALIESLRLDQVAPPTDVSNRFAGNSQAIELGKLLFNDPGLSASGEVSCATCHQQAKGFADGKRLSAGSKQTARHTPALLGIAHASWFYWDGRRDSLWAQALTPIETQGEMDNNRTDALRYIAGKPGYARLFQTLAGSDGRVLSELSDTDRFPLGASPFGAGKFQWHRMSEDDKNRVNQAYASLGKIIASYEATLQHRPSRFDEWAATLAAKAPADGTQALLSEDEQAGLRLFLDLPKTQCLRCHNGGLFTNQGFHNVATSDTFAEGQSHTGASHDFGRMLGLQAVIVDPFNCSGEFSDAPADGCDHLRFARRQNLGETIDGAFKVPSLRNLATTAPYFHDGRFDTLEAVIDHYRNQTGGENSRVSEVPDIAITDRERDQLVAFLKTL